MAARITSQLSKLTLLSSSSSVCLPPLSRSYYVYKDPNYKHFRPNFAFKRKHYIPKFKKARSLKVIKLDLPNLNEKSVEEMTPDEIRAKMKEKGIQPVRPWQEKPVYVASTSGTFEAYVPPEGDGKLSATSKAGAKQKFQFLEKKGKSMIAIRKIRQYDEDFDPKVFAEEAQKIYIETHEALADFDKVRLHQNVTERAYPLVTHQSRQKTIRWQFLGSLAPPHVVHARCTELLNKENVFAQVTVRFHTKQTLAVYDRFGRLQHGSEVVARDVLEYVVFEKHVASSYGTWRIHDKIIPDWMPPRQPILKTYRFEDIEPEVKTTPDDKESKEVEVATVTQNQSASPAYA
ncbi:probable 39S ribosomal protein L45, mitochondrial [Homarus americanus]|uniref:Large ribosomal subunit protein mL45 n=1 Tax=Homarus americanus TaxID=6706 RepID=A0A8J5N2H1_HOMAM|nr:probable 39S ribosomal protein L45, mitochondrial [Homarus americanus]KAG7172108.1 39S ribosomal protein L45-like [Homarus americanus]